MAVSYIICYSWGSHIVRHHIKYINNIAPHLIYVQYSMSANNIWAMLFHSSSSNVVLEIDGITYIV